MEPKISNENENSIITSDKSKVLVLMNGNYANLIDCDLNLNFSRNLSIENEIIVNFEMKSKQC